MRTIIDIGWNIVRLITLAIMLVILMTFLFYLITGLRDIIKEEINERKRLSSADQKDQH